MNEYRVKVSIRNNLILSAMEAQGYKGWGSVSRFCEDAGISYPQLSGLLTFRHKPINDDGEFSVAAKALMEALGAAPSDLWTDQQLVLSLPRNNAEATANADMIRAVLLTENEAAMTLPSPEESVGADIRKRLVYKLLSEYVRPKDLKVLELRFGLNGGQEYSLQECGEIMGVTRERIRQIETRALRSLGHPSRLVALKPALDDCADVS